MTVKLNVNEIWVKSILLDTILNEEALKTLNIPSILQPSIINNVCRYVVKHIIIPDDLSDELLLFCEFLSDPAKGCNSPTIAKIFSEFLARHVPVITLMMAVSPTTFN